MALASQNGHATVHGIPGTNIAIEGYASFILMDAKLDHKFKLTAVEDENEADVNLIASNEHVECVITWTPSSTTRALAADTAIFLAPLRSLTLSGFGVDLLNGDWIYVGDATINLTHGPAKQSLKVRKYVDSTQNTLLNTSVS